MAILDRVEADPADVEWIRSLENVLSDPEPMRSTFARFLNLPTRDVDFVIESDQTPPLGIFGFGLHRLARAQWVPVVLVMPEFLRGQPPSLAPSELTQVLGEVSGVQPRPFLLRGIEPPDDQYATVHGSQYGTLGLPVRLPDGREGALTAGHVAQDAGMSVLIDGTLRGTVVHSDHRRKHSHPEACADVAAVELPNGWHFARWRPAVSGIGDASELDVVRALNRSGTGAAGAPVRTIGNRFSVDSFGAWADYLMTDPPISVGGDSGAVVVNEKAQVVGQIVGGKEGSYSIVQDIDLLLTETNCTEL